MEGSVVAILAAVVGVWAYVSCPRLPRALRCLTLFLAVLILWLAADTIVRYLLAGR